MNNVTIPQRQLDKFVDKLDEYIEEDRLTREELALSNDGGEREDLSEPLVRISTSIDAMTRTLGKLVRIGGNDEENNAAPIAQNIQNISNYSKETRNNTEVIWESNAEAHNERLSSFSTTHKLLRQIRDPLETIAYSVADKLFQTPDVQTREDDTDVTPEDKNGQLVRLSSQTIQALNHGMVDETQVQELQEKLEQLQKENTKDDTKDRLKIHEMLMNWWEDRWSHEDKQDKKQWKQQLKDNKLTRLSYAKMYNVMDDIKDGFVDLRVMMALRMMMSGVGSIFNFLKTGVGGHLLKFGGAYVLGEMITEATGTLLDKAEQFAPEFASDFIKKMREKIAEIFEALPAGADIVASTLTGLGAMKFGPKLMSMITSFLTTVLKFGMRAIPGLGWAAAAASIYEMFEEQIDAKLSEWGMPDWMLDFSKFEEKMDELIGQLANAFKQWLGIDSEKNIEESLDDEGNATTVHNRDSVVNNSAESRVNNYSYVTQNPAASAQPRTDVTAKKLEANRKEAEAAEKQKAEVTQNSQTNIQANNTTNNKIETTPIEARPIQPWGGGGAYAK